MNIFHFLKLIRNTCFSLSVLLLLIGCDGGTELSGVIETTDGIPIEGAITKLVITSDSVYPIESEDVTTKIGEYGVLITHAPVSPDQLEVQLTVSKEGYKTYTEFIQAGTYDIAYDIKLEREPEHENKGE